MEDQMLLLLSVILGLVAGWLKKGRFINLTSLRLLWLPVLSFAITPIVSYFPDIPSFPKAALIVFSYSCIFVFIYANRRFKLGSGFLGLGSLCNFVVIASNGFRMPVSESALTYYSGMTAEAVLERNADYFIAVGGNAKLLILGDVICIPLPVIGGFISMGDIILSIGMFLLIFFSMTQIRENPSR